MARNKGYILLLAVFLAVLWIFLLPGPRVANDFPFAFQENLKAGFNFTQIWTDRSGVAFGEFVIHTVWSWPTDFLYGIGGKIGLSFTVLERVLGFIPVFLLGTWSISKLLGYLKVSRPGKIIGGVAYLLNTYILLLIDGGQISIALAYAFIPLAFLTTIKAVDGVLKQKIFAAISILILGIFDIRFIYVLAILLLLYFFYSLIFVERSGARPKRLLNWVTLGIISVAVYIGLNFYWLLPAVAGKSPVLPATYTRASQTSFLNFTQLKHAASLLQPNWYENVFGKVPPFRKEFLLIPVLVLIAPILRRKDKNVWFWVAVAAVSVFLAKGASPPLPEIYPWLFTHVPGFSLFRDSTKSFFLVALSYSILIGFAVDEIIRRLPKLKIIFPLILAGYFIFLIRPVYLGKMTGTFSNPPNQKEYFLAADKLEGDSSFGRIFWIPSKSPLGFSSPTHPSVDALTISGKRPFATGTVGTYEFLNFTREAPYMGEIMKVSGIKYLAYPYPDTRRVTLKPEEEIYYHTFLGQLTALPWIKGRISDYPIPILEVKSVEDRFFVAPKTYLALGPDTYYSDLVKIPGFDLSKYALIWGEESPGAGELLNKNIPDKVILFGKTTLDLSASFIDKNKFIFPATELNFSPDNSGWWKREAIDFVWFRDFLQQKYGIDNADFDYGGGYAIAEGTKELMVKSEKLKVGDVLLVRIMRSSKGGGVAFYQDGNLIGEVDTKLNKPAISLIKLTGSGEVPDRYYKYDAADFTWIKVGILSSASPITLKTEGQINVVNAIVAVPDSELNDISARMSGLIAENKVVIWNKLSEKEKTSLFGPVGALQVTYRALAPTHYKVEVSGIKNPSTLVFSESYDTLWASNGAGSYKVYSLLNGFSVNNDGTYDIYFTPQKYVVPGLIVSGITLVVVLIFCII